MYLRDVLKLALMNVFRGKTRNFLTVLAITIGVSSVLLVSAFGTGGEKLINSELQKLGLRGISVFQNQSSDSVPLDEEDAARLEKRFKYIKKALPIVLETGKIKLNKTSSDAILLGVGAYPEEVYNVTLLHGKTPDKADIDKKNRVVVIDDELALKAYKRKNIVGKYITIEFNEKKEIFTIIGVIKSQKEGINQLLGNSLPNFIYLPYSTLNDLREKTDISQIAVSCVSGYTSEGTEFSDFLSKVKSAPGSYSSKNVSAKISEIKSISGLVSSVMSAVAGIALLVAGIGIMNAMLSSASERKREIGILMAIGAKKRNVLICFLCEAVVIVTLGGMLGALIGLIFLNGISKFIEFKVMFDFKTFLATEIISFICGIVFAIIPAFKASNVNPIIALGRE